ncbi:type II toxin-antitoxin system VapC family toxin [Sphingobium cloacae]|uniref:type II toxin-antitoxin system VapC family toxin n=1 Tax=Sphingobium cloacae TaxID=120107 RepID=UPI000F4DC0E3|nr:type II toxin-antitoxin system VapC family toxin [Sphingobium cloacae]
MDQRSLLSVEIEADLVEIGHVHRHCRRRSDPTAIWETTIAVARILGLSVEEVATAVEQFLELAGIEVVAVDPAIRYIAVSAFDRYGKSRHPAGLNFGDCFAYACARHARVPLLYKGDDFPQTDIETA